MHNLTSVFGGKHESSILQYDSKTKIASNKTHASLNFGGWYTVQVGPNLFGFKHSTPVDFMMWSGLRGNEVLTTHPKSTPPTPRHAPSLANYADEFIFVIGGGNPNNHSDKYASVDFFTIGTDTWS